MRDQLVGEIEGVVHAAVHPHAADRAVHVGGIAGEDRAADAELLRHALMHGVEIAADRYRNRCPMRQEALQPRLQRLRPRQRRPRRLGSVGKCTRQRSGGPFQWNRFDHSSGSEM